MYKILHFRGGLYRFDELVEFVEDTGGMVLSEDRFEIIRGDSYLSQEVHVLVIVPEDEKDNVKSLISEIKGMVEEIKPTGDQNNLFLSYFSIYDALNRIGDWANKNTLKETISCPCYAELCTYFGEEECQLDDLLEEILIKMHISNVIEHRESKNGKHEYRLKK
ncbi:methyl-coenzyme M reductase family protein [Methanobacterium oryzae]|uniref:methyl-coenzyme M reductase family protein n=1 Tax=Methanobacterium oryzae TaxID=69540 RepID=UPI003D25C438